ncbi:MAG: DUF3826 domain-containing protein [Pedobacter sp.]|nr:DUF3826 domain-containing protein [Chitinophagaceae bacterium]
MIAIFTCCLLAFAIVVKAQDNDVVKQASYTTTITQRANKIVVVLGITDSSKFYRVQTIIVQQYRNLSAIHDSLNAKIKATKASGADKESIATMVKTIEDDRMVQLAKCHQLYITKLTAELLPEQVIKVKDGMTYSILPITNKAYQEMLPTLTEQQKAQIINYLTEAREYAMDAESSDKKHAWFGKYKGKINNYLSAAGIDMKKAGQEWEERIKAAKAN